MQAEVDNTAPTEDVATNVIPWIRREREIKEGEEQLTFQLIRETIKLLSSYLEEFEADPYIDRESAITYPIERVLSWLQYNMINVSRPSEVREYLFRYPDLTDFLPSICYRVRERFGRQVQLHLEVYRDPEIMDEYLTLYVEHPHLDEHLLAQIDEISVQNEQALADRLGWFLLIFEI